jgi:hypothetical protein
VDNDDYGFCEPITVSELTLELVKKRDDNVHEEVPQLTHFHRVNIVKVHNFSSDFLRDESSKYCRE